MKEMTVGKGLIVSVALIALLALVAVPASAGGYTHGIVIDVDGVDYYMAGAPDGPNGEFDVPGHAWVQAGPEKVVGKHYNTGPFGAPQWWSSDAPDGELLFVVKGIIDTWSPEKAAAYAARGYVHRHELITVADGTPHPTKVVWFKHIARTTFTLDGWPHPPVPCIEITPGVAYNFLPNGYMPYPPQ
jgi:selenium-binding protein 1